MNQKPPVLGSSFSELKKKARQVPEIDRYLNSYSVIIGNIVYARRTELGYTQQQLADLAGTTQARVSHIEAGEGNVTMNVLNNIFKVLRLQDLQPSFDELSTALENF